jgi:transcriptional regulator with XRE-family HTH domain
MVEETTIRIRAAMMRKGITGAHIARKLGISRQTVNETINLRPRYRSSYIRKAIAEAVGIRYKDLWGTSPLSDDSIVRHYQRAVNG